MNVNTIRQRYSRLKPQIEERLEEHDELGKNGTRKDLFAEMAYCITTPQTHYEQCQAAYDELLRRKFLFLPLDTAEEVIAFTLHKNQVRFPNRKAKYIVEARTRLYDTGCNPDIRKLVRELRALPARDGRDKLYEMRILGLGMKECSHFMRNIGNGDGLALLDRHVMGTLQEFGIVSDVPKSISRQQYLSVESAMEKWCSSIGIPIAHMDILLFDQATGEISM